MAGSQMLAFDIVGNASSAARAFKDTADSSALAARAVKDASRALDLQSKSATVAAGATLALARADKVLADAELSLARDVTVANAVLGRQATALLGGGTAGAVGAMLSAAASGKAPAGGGGTGLAPGIAMAAAALGVARQNTRLFSDSISQGTPVWDGARKGIFGLNGELLLFGGALKSVGVPAFLSAATTVHLLSEAVIETSGTLIPAAIAFSAFGIAAVPTVQAIYTQMKNLYTISQATGTQMPGLTGNFSRMAAAVQPEVYTLFGEALVFASRGTGTFQQLATGAGTVLDQLGARFVAATTQGRGFSTFAAKATSDLSAWGTGIGNVGGIIGNLLKVLPGYAEDLASVFDGVSHDIEVVTGSGLGQWVLSVGLAAHGALFYVGLMGTGFAVLASRTLPLVANGALAAATAIEGFGPAGKAAAGGLTSFAAQAEGAAALPWGWISIAAAGIGFLVYQFVTARDAAQQFNSAMQNAIANSTLGNLSTTISSSIAQTQDRVTTSTRQLTTALKDSAAAQNSAVFAGKSGELQDQATAEAVTRSANATRDYTAGLTQLQQQQQLVAGRVNSLAKEYGGQSQALALLNAAGITSAQITDTSNQHWAQALIEIQAQNAALKEMNVNTGALGSNYVNTLLPAVQKVTAAQDTQLNAIIGSEQAFTAWGQGIQQADKDASAYHATLGGLNSQSLTLANDYYSTLIPASQKVLDALQAQGTSTRDLTTAVADEVKQMLPFTAGNTAAKSVLVDLVNNALGPGTVSMQDLSTWTSRNSGTMDGFRAIVDKATISAGNLAGTLSGLLNQAFATDLLRASGATGAMNAYATALTLSGDNAQATRSARATLIADLEKAGYSADAATRYVDGLQQKIDALHGVNVAVGVHASGSGSITATENVPGGVAAKQLGHLVFFAGGGMVTGGTPGRDSVISALMPGELVVPAAMVAGGAVDHLRGKLPGFAAGGLVGAVDFTAAQGGSFAASTGTAFGNAVAAAFQKDAAAAAAAAAAAGGAGGSAVTRWAPDILRVLAMLRQDSSNLGAVEHRISVESGGNPNAINLWDVNAKNGDPSRGLMQVIGATFARYRSFALSGNIYDPMANIFAGINYAVQAYAPRPLSSVMLQAGGYDNGGPLMPGYTLAYNGTGRPEMVIPNRGAGAASGDVHVHLHNHGVIGSQAQLDNWLRDGVERLANKGRLKWAFQQSPSARG